ncbi:ribonuclease E/G [Phenylobacterium sp. LH3H17]|uniref:ribonuclease E/G n=1 Tax=Phenylobacterium sp. LH3H17 TaxID=2903901 RepID=UPI0020C963F1|nr:ribonuclease E/G [Phenylobacterium sp. LH3H17]UTP41191.1 ribonuclease E/G [Phenylobacterium sp. LH3H17]
MSERRLYLDRGVGETRGVVTLDGRPERLLIARDGESATARLGARLVGRIRKVEPAFASAFVDLGGVEALLSYRPEARPVEGQSLEVEIRTEARAGKLATVRAIGPAEGPPRLLTAAPGIAEQLAGFARNVQLIEGREARRAADEAEADALEIVHPLPGGGTLAIEPTRALVAIDVDIGERKGQDAKRVTRQANLTALAVAGRLLRLKSLGGIVVIDLVGRGHDGNALMTAARAAFAPDNPGVAIGPVGRFGTMELTVPRRAPPVAELLCDAKGRLTDLTLALRLIRAIETEGAAQPGARLTAVCAPEIATAAQPFAAGLAGRIGARFEIRSDPAAPRERFDVSGR